MYIIAMDRGYIKLWRKSIDSPCWKNKEMWRVWSYCLMKASWKPTDAIVGFSTIPLKAGQFIFGRKTASFETKLSERTIRTCMKHLENMQNLTVKSTNRYSIITIKNWDTYQEEKTNNDQQHDHHVTSKRPASDHIQEVKEVKEVKNKSLKHCASSDAPSNGDGTFYMTKKKRKLTGKRLDSFDRFWEAFDYKRGRATAADAWLDIPSITDTMVNRIVERAEKEASNRHTIVSQGRTPKMAQGWISERRWEDEDFDMGTLPPIDTWKPPRQEIQ
jgi:hypothetical protein